MARLLQFTVISASYCMNGGRLPRGGTFTISVDDPRAQTYKDDGCLKMTLIDGRGSEPVEEKVENEEEYLDVKMEDIEDKHVPLKLKNLLLEAGLKTAQEVIDAEVEKLTEIKGIGEKLATNIIEGCSLAIDEAAEEDDDDDDNDDNDGEE